MDAAVKPEPVDLAVAMRPVEAGDHHFVLSAWMQSYKPMVRGVSSGDYFRGQQNLISELGTRRRIIVACDAETPAYLYGFVCGAKLTNSTLIDYVYVKKLYRGRGVAKGLLAELGFSAALGAVVTHATSPGKLRKLGPHASYNPYWNSLGYSDV